jgi:hypothetical protein
MTRRLAHAELIASDEVIAPPLPRACNDRSFELPPVLHIATAAMFLGFVGVLSFAFRNPEMAIPFAIFTVFICAFFAVPALWARMEPAESRTAPLRWGRFMEDGIATASGRVGGAEATVLVLLLPSLILCWAISVAVIAALV